jgi:hypothetical protein
MFIIIIILIKIIVEIIVTIMLIIINTLFQEGNIYDIKK